MRPGAGWYGKVAALGDFAARRLEAGWVQRCDRWLAAGMQALERRGPQGLASYLAAPLWRWAWAPGVVDAQWWFGVLMPSCDSVGRYYPLVVAQARPRPPADRWAFDHLDLWWSRAAQAALHTLAEDASIERFEDELDHLPPWPAAAAASCRAVGGGRFETAAGATPGDLAHAIAEQALLQRLDGASLWWPLREGSTQCSLAAGLPDAALLAAMLQGG
ncbi:MAG: type VI secretion system-associated protein TagF [Burkholderiales bacterium]|nr:type VI secretion system-associated protein TagF [Burkholderiales bacterium]MDE1928868.1 type VI secretion system-associated protein TagF [Burkholderiales bacterium]MDE2160956.1 type VI secretion system-associated protein TagF [Burkholderiales bacterium]MDE2505329.1 type VI secretion system-associated protein TagF [Burkholderiales bacterium]